MKFIFKAKDQSGELKAGTIDAANNEVAIELLQKNNLFPISIEAEKEKDSIERAFLKLFDRISAKEQMIFFRQLAILIEARVPIVAALMAIENQTDNKYFKKIILDMVADVQDGIALSDAFRKHRDIFSDMAINIVRSGEVSGNLKRSVEYIADNIEKNYQLASRIKSAIMYPSIVLTALFVIGFLVISFVVPKLTIMIKSLGSQIEIPWYTQFIIDFSDFMAFYWWEVGLAIIAFIGVIIYYIKSEDGSKEWDQIKIRLPIFGKIYQNLYVARFADNLAVLLAGGIPIMQALTIVSSVINNIVYEQIFLKAADEVRIGGTISNVLRRSPQIPSIVAQMVKIGEESGQIDSVLGHIARFYEQEADYMTKNLSTLIEPFFMIVIGIAVAFLSFSVIMPIYNIAGQL